MERWEEDSPRNSDVEDKEHDSNYHWIDWYFEKELKRNEQLLQEPVVEPESPEGVANIAKKNDLDRKWKKVGVHPNQFDHEKCNCKCCEWLGNCQADLCPPMDLEAIRRDKNYSKIMSYPPIAVNVYLTNMTLDHLSRHEMINWVNGRLDSNFSTIEELSSGAGYCQFLDMLFPGIISLKKVKFEARAGDEFINNFKMLQYAFQKLQVDKVIPIEKLIKGRFQDNFKFLQWFKKFFEANYKPCPYNAYKARGGIQLGGIKCSKCLEQNGQKKKSNLSLNVNTKNDTLTLSPSYRQHRHRDVSPNDFRRSPKL